MICTRYSSTTSLFKIKPKRKKKTWLLHIRMSCIFSGSMKFLRALRESTDLKKAKFRKDKLKRVGKKS